MALLMHADRRKEKSLCLRRSAAPISNTLKSTYARQSFPGFRAVSTIFGKVQFFSEVRPRTMEEGPSGTTPTPPPRTHHDHNIPYSQGLSWPADPAALGRR